MTVIEDPATSTARRARERHQAMINDHPRGTHRLGALTLSVSEPVTGAGAIVDELRPIVGTGEQAYLAVQLADSALPLEDARFYKPVTVGAGNSFRLTRRWLDYRVDYDGGRTVVSVVPRVVQRPRSRLIVERWRDWNYLSHAERSAKTFFYEAFDYLVQASQLPLGQSWLHAGAVEKDGRAVLFTGWGGVGKTTATLKLCLEQGYRFLSDDLGVLGADGRFHRGPKKLQVYGYNLVGEPGLERQLMRGRGPLDRTSWHRKLKTDGPTGVRRRISAEDLLGPERVASSAEVATILLIERGDVRRPVRKDLDLDAFARRSTATVLSELSPFSSISQAYHSAEINLDLPHLPTVAGTVALTRDVIQRGASGKPIVQITLPASAGPEDVIREVTPHL